ncbi:MULTISPECIES: glycosyltransferase [Flavobacterium]|uniref:Glycosyltransferase family 4 protein n=1 Tax=Flavobacterium keumense TaxID=1306518 RepID=A0ABY8N8V3_9FLAO|nr:MULTISPECIES: glycosyltransferase family 4 protein [Flavobacterium]WGK95608.1 glycosyltransferase family 4 protein [Flavobacterium keumense]
MDTNKRLLIIGFVWPEPNSSAAGGRMMRLISLFKKQGFAITFASPAQDSDFMVSLADFGVDKAAIELNESSFDLFLKELQPSVVLFDRFMIEEQFGWRVAEHCPDAVRILDTEDLHCLRLARQNSFKANREFEVLDLLQEEVAKREIASILRSDVSLMVSEYEMEVLQSVFKIDQSLLFYLPLMVDSVDWNILSFEQRQRFVFIGNFLHEPNWNAVQYLKETIWPLIRKQLPTTVLEIYGAYPSQKVFQLHNEKEGFIIKGRAENAKEVISNARVLLAPLRFGAGIKGKLLEAMEYGTPSVTSSIGAESMRGALDWNGSIEDNPQQFADASIQLYQDEIVWKQSQQNGFEIIKQRYLKELFEDEFKNTIAELQMNLKMHRQNNFLGQMLSHHTMQSTKYMSRWIEEKNKK